MIVPIGIFFVAIFAGAELVALFVFFAKRRKCK
mgnify:CR=1 FL=1